MNAGRISDAISTQTTIQEKRRAIDCLRPIRPTIRRSGLEAIPPNVRVAISDSLTRRIITALSQNDRPKEIT